jgi:hypothetical protein
MRARTKHTTKLYGSRMQACDAKGPPNSHSSGSGASIFGQCADGRKISQPGMRTHQRAARILGGVPVNLFRDQKKYGAYAPDTRSRN